jgi:hypothetical protein
MRGLILLVFWLTSMWVGWQIGNFYVRWKKRKADQWPCPICGSSTVWDGRKIHYTDCKSGLG